MGLRHGEPQSIRDSQRCSSSPHRNLGLRVTRCACRTLTAPYSDPCPSRPSLFLALNLDRMEDTRCVVHLLCEFANHHWNRLSLCAGCFGTLETESTLLD